MRVPTSFETKIATFKFSVPPRGDASAIPRIFFSGRLKHSMKCIFIPSSNLVRYRPTPIFTPALQVGLCLVGIIYSGIAAMAETADWKTATSVYDFTVNDIAGNPVSLEKYRGHVLLIVNVASKCGLTSTNYRELAELHDQYHDSKGLRILAFPCNQFGGQEPGTNEDIVCFAKKKQANFELFDKIKVNGEDASPLWKYLKKEQGGTLGDMIKWNFTKFIVDKEGKVVERHGPTTEPSKLVSSLEKYW